MKKFLVFALDNTLLGTVHGDSERECNGRVNELYARRLRYIRRNAFVLVPA